VQFIVSLAALSVIFLAVAALERVPALRFAPSRFLRPHLLTDAAWYAVAAATSLVTAVAFRPQLQRLAIPGVAQRIGAAPTAVALVGAVALYDLVAFHVHRLIHRSDVLWTVHKVHHSTRRLDWLATTRTHMFEHLVRNLPAQAALFAVGIPVPVIAAAIAVYAVFALIGHSNLAVDLRWAEPLFITPRLHRLHHVPATTHNNFGTVFSLWDHLAGTLTVRDTAIDEPIGVPGELDSYPQRFVDAVRQPLRQLRARRADHQPRAVHPETIDADARLPTVGQRHSSVTGPRHQ